MNAEACGPAIPAWFRGPGPWSSAVLWSAAEVRRNLADRLFVHRHAPDAFLALMHDLSALCDGVPELPTADPERLPGYDAARGASVFGPGAERRRDGRRLSDDGGLAAHLGEQDHLLLRACRPGFDPLAAMNAALDALRSLEAAGSFAYDERTGFLTADPKHCGTGLRLKVLAHLPALVQTGAAPEKLGELGERKMLLQGWYAEDERVHGDLFLLSTSASLGRSEKTIAGEFTRLVARLAADEAAAREAMLADDRRLLEDRVYRSLGILRGARLVGAGEAVGRLSLLRLGVLTELLEGLDAETIAELLLSARLVDPNRDEADAERADLLREGAVSAREVGT